MDARFDAAAKLERMLASTGKGALGQKFGALWDIVIVGLSYHLIELSSTVVVITLAFQRPVRENIY